MRTIQAWECKISILITMIIAFIIPGRITENGNLIDYVFGFPCDFLLIHQRNKGGLQLYSNMFNGNQGIRIEVLGLFANIVIIYVIVVLIKKIYIKIRNR